MTLPVLRAETTGLLFALAGFALFSVGDVFVKSIVDEWPAPAIAALRYIFGALFLMIALLAFEGRRGFVMLGLGWQILRGVGVGISSMAFFSALQVMPLATATSIAFTSPIMTALLAAVLLREPMRWATWIASFAAFGGVLLVLKPSISTIGLAALLPLLAAFGMAMLLVGNRAVAGRASALSMQFSVALTAMLVLGPIVALGHVGVIPGPHVGVPHWSVVAKCAVIAVLASCAHALVYLGTTRAGAATIAPMAYVQLLMAGLFGWLIFGERPDALALVGAAIIVAAGLYLWRSGRVADEPQGID